MDIKIAGSGEVAPGEYDAIHIAGSGRLQGPIRCSSLSCSGSAHGDGEIEATGSFTVSGSGHFGQTVRAGELQIRGAFACGGSLKCGTVDIRGAASVSGDAEGERIFVSGKLNCKGLVNAEEIDIRSSNSNGGEMHIGSIGGSRISISPKEGGEGDESNVNIGCLFGWIRKDIRTGGKMPCTVRVKDAIEGDSISLEYVTAERVSGRVVTVGPHCEIALVQYSEQADISPDAKVGKLEKI